jgi:hypothetical protein
MAYVSAGNNVKVDSSILDAHLRDYAKVMGKNLGVVVKQQAGLFCKDMISYTRPFATKRGDDGATAKAKEVGISNVTKAVFKVFQPLQNALPSDIANIGSFDVFKMWEKRNGGSDAKGRKMRWTQFQEKFRDGSRSPAFINGDKAAMETLHRSLRQDGGKGPLFGYASKSKRPFAFVAKESDIASYARQKAKDVGTLKSAYWFAAQRIAENIVVPAWAKQAGGASNAIADNKANQPMKPEVTVGNTIGNKLGNQRFTQAALNHRAFAMRNAMMQELKKKKIPLWLATAKGMTSGTSQYFS